MSTGKTASEEEVADSLPPTQYLVLEVLAARARLGEACWTFPTRLRPALDALQGLGLIWWRHAPVPACVQAYLTDAGREAVLSPGYVPPVTVTGAGDGIRLRQSLTARQGRKVPRMLYRQTGDAPDDGDPIIGLVDTPELAALIVAAVNGSAARDEFLAASIAVWREIDRLDSRPEGCHPTWMDVDLRKAERAAWERYRDLLDARPASMLEPVTFGDDDEAGLKRVPMRPVDEAEDTR